MKKTDVVSAGGLETGAVVGIASAAFLLGLVVATVALFWILRCVGYVDLYLPCVKTVSVLHDKRNHFAIFSTNENTTLFYNSLWDTHYDSNIYI